MSPNGPEHTAKPTQRSRMLTAAILPALAVLVLWVVYLLDQGFELGLYRYGIGPRELEGLRGILFSAFIHSDTEHIFNNTIPVFVLGWSLLYFYPRIAGRVALASWLLSGLWVWISARPSMHIGASGVVYGLAAFIFTSGLIRRQRTLMAVALLVVFLYGSMIWGMFPIVPRMSWESHLWGAVVGVIMAWFYRGVPPAVPDPQPAFALEDEHEAGEVQPHEHSPAPGPVRIVYHFDPGDEVDDEELRWKRELARRTGPMDPGSTSGTWIVPEEDR